MASINQVKHYLACWFQLGKPLYIPRESKTLLPNPVRSNLGYSEDFDNCWPNADRPENCRYLSQ